MKSVKTPQQLMQFLNNNFEYGVVDNNGNKHCDSNSDIFQEVCNNQWKMRSVKQMLEDGVGHCYDQVEIERKWFEDNGYEVKTFWISAYQEGVENSGFSHTYLLFADGEKWLLFEHSDFANRGIFEFETVEAAIRWQAGKQVAFAEKIVKSQQGYSVCIKQYQKPPIGVNMDQFLDFVEKSTNVVV